MTESEKYLYSIKDRLHNIDWLDICDEDWKVDKSALCQFEGLHDCELCGKQMPREAYGIYIQYVNRGEDFVCADCAADMVKKNKVKLKKEKPKCQK